MPRVVKRSASEAVKSGLWHGGVPLPRLSLRSFPDRLKPPSGLQWLHEIKLDGDRMAARIDSGRVQLLDPDRP